MRRSLVYLMTLVLAASLACSGHAEDMVEEEQLAGEGTEPSSEGVVVSVEEEIVLTGTEDASSETGAANPEKGSEQDQSAQGNSPESGQDPAAESPQEKAEEEKESGQAPVPESRQDNAEEEKDAGRKQVPESEQGSADNEQESGGDQTAASGQGEMALSEAGSSQAGAEDQNPNNTDDGGASKAETGETDSTEPLQNQTEDSLPGPTGTEGGTVPESAPETAENAGSDQVIQQEPDPESGGNPPAEEEKVKWDAEMTIGKAFTGTIDLEKDHYLLRLLLKEATELVFRTEDLPLSLEIRMEGKNEGISLSPKRTEDGYEPLNAVRKLEKGEYLITVLPAEKDGEGPFTLRADRQTEEARQEAEKPLDEKGAEENVEDADGSALPQEDLSGEENPDGQGLPESQQEVAAIVRGADDGISGDTLPEFPAADAYPEAGSEDAPGHGGDDSGNGEAFPENGDGGENNPVVQDLPEPQQDEAVIVRGADDGISGNTLPEPPASPEGGSEDISGHGADDSGNGEALPEKGDGGENPGGTAEQGHDSSPLPDSDGRIADGTGTDQDVLQEEKQMNTTEEDNASSGIKENEDLISGEKADEETAAEQTVVVRLVSEPQAEYHLGDVLVYRAEMERPDEEVRIIWEGTFDGETWFDLGAEGEELVLVISEKIAGMWVRVRLAEQ